MALIQAGTRGFEADVVIFDKDGTLIDFTATWVGIVRMLLDAMGRHLPMTDALEGMVQDALGVRLDSGSVDPGGVLAMGTSAECYALLAYCLHREGMRWDEAQALVRTLDEEVFRSRERSTRVKAAKGALPLLGRLKDKGVKVAVATNDKTEDALSDMAAIGAQRHIDMVVGYDGVKEPKPSPEMVYKICEGLGSTPGDAVLVGDTVMDAALGRNARVGLTVGVTGIELRDVLEGCMDVVIDSLEEIS
jgi:phosphoglycolate phosphatase